MIALRRLAGVALVAGMFAGLVTCTYQTRAVGEELDGPVVRPEPKPRPSSGAGAETVDLPPKPDSGPQAAETVDLSSPKDATTPQPVTARPNVDAAPPIRDTKSPLWSGAEDHGVPAKPGPKVEVADDPPAPKPTEPPPPTPPAPTPAEETPAQRAERLLKEAQKEVGVADQATIQEAEAAYQAGVRLFNNLEYEEAKVQFERALALDPAHPQALGKLKIVNSLLGAHVDKAKVKMMELENAERVRVQESLIALAQSIDEARQLEERGSAVPVELDPDDKDRILSDQLDYLKKAQALYRRVKEIINWMPPNIDLPQLRSVVDQSLIRVRQKITEKEDEISFGRRVAASKAAEDQRVRESDLFRQRVNKLLEQVKEFYDRQQYRAAENLAKRILIIEPLNADAEAWKNKARASFHTKEETDIREDTKLEFRRSWQDVEEASISYAPLIQYPSNWDQITRRAEGSTIGNRVKEEPWKQEIRKKLQRRVTFDFADTPLTEAIEFLRQVSNVTMILDPKAVAGAMPAINLRVTDMRMEDALGWILRLAELEFALRDNAIFISKPQNLQAAVELRIYDVSDLTQVIPDFPGPEFQITVAGDAQSQAAAANPFTAPPPVVPTLTSIADMIRNRVRPDRWDQTLGTSIEERGGKLVVMQTPELHALVDQLLSNFRSTQKMMINIESRFLTIREAYLEDIGVEFQGLDPNVLFGDFGDIRRLGAPTGFVQPRVPGGTDGIPPNAPFPGFVNGPDRVGGGLFSEVGSIVNHTINFFNNDPDTISGLDAANNVRQGGLSSQVTILNNAQVQAFIRALAVRENTSTLIAPRLTVFNTQRAHMFVARQQSYIADYDISGDSYDPLIRQFLVGVVLDVKPIVSSDRRYVTLELRPTVTELVNFVTRQIDTFTVNSGATVNVLVFLSFPIQFPELSIRRIRTTATCPDGGILLLGGLYRNVKFNAENGVPFLSDLPVIGRVFRWNTVDNARSNLAILISPRIILFNEEEDKLH